MVTTSGAPDRLPPVVVREATRIQLCGRLIVELQGRRLEDTLRGRQGRLLFAYLVLQSRPAGPPRRAGRGAVVGQGRAARLRVAARAAAHRACARRSARACSRAARELHADPARRTPGSTGRPRASGSARAPRERRRPAAPPGTPPARRSRSPTAACCPASRRRGSTPRRGELADLRVEALEALAAAGARLGGAALPEAEQAARAAVAGRSRSASPPAPR